MSGARRLIPFVPAVFLIACQFSAVAVAALGPEQRQLDRFLVGLVIWFGSLLIGIIPLVMAANDPRNREWRISLWLSLLSTMISWVGVYLFVPLT